MEFSKLNRLIFETLESIAPIGTSRVSMFNIEDKYSHIPFLRFRFKNKSKDDEIYNNIQAAIDNFEGHLKWKLVPAPNVENFLIIPVFNKESKIIEVEKKDIISLYGEDYYRNKILECIEDIPKLADAIGGCSYG